jgi:hypothetical protein
MIVLLLWVISNYRQMQILCSKPSLIQINLEGEVIWIKQFQISEPKGSPNNNNNNKKNSLEHK